MLIINGTNISTVPIYFLVSIICIISWHILVYCMMIYIDRYTIILFFPIAARLPKVAFGLVCKGCFTTASKHYLQYLEPLLSLASLKCRNATSDGGRSLFRRIHRSSFLRCFFAWLGNSLGNHYNLAEFVMRKDDPAIFWERFHDIYEAWSCADRCLSTLQTDLDYTPPFCVFMLWRIGHLKLLNQDVRWNLPQNGP